MTPPEREAAFVDRIGASMLAEPHLPWRERPGPKLRLALLPFNIRARFTCTELVECIEPVSAGTEIYLHSDEKG